jgi:abortive infection bacteriophage resistance protein
LKFNKPPLTFDNQVELLISRGLNVTDSNAAAKILSNINYYRLGTYSWSFIEDHSDHDFVSGTYFEDIVDLYNFDRELRLLVLDSIERVEVALRTQWAYHLASEKGSHCYLDRVHFNQTKFNFEDFIRSLEVEFKRTSEKNILRQRSKYEENMPAIWITCELISFGWLSQCYDGINSRKIKTKIANHFELNEAILSSFLHHITTVRNVCAHHSRLWNRDFTFKMKIPIHGNSLLLKSLNTAVPDRLYNSLVFLEYLMNIINPQHQWKMRLFTLLKKHNIDFAQMGFPVNWKNLPIWK